MQDLQILVVNAMAEDAKGREAMGIFLQMLTGIVGRSASIVLRKMDEIGDYVLDWEHDVLTESSKSKAKRFDKVEILFVIGDTKVLPWDSRALQLVTLLHMANFTKKATFCCGSGALHNIYSLATRGSRFHIVNGPNGEVLQRLPMYPRFAVGTAQFPCGWLDHETGDVYDYNPSLKNWYPKCNFGVSRLASSGVPPSELLRPARKKLSYKTRLLAVHQDVEPIDDREDIVHVLNKSLHHFSVRKLPDSKFVLTLMPNWYINGLGSLPPAPGMTIVAEGAFGPVILVHSNALLLACEINQGKSHWTVRRIVKNFIRHTVQRMEASKGSNIDSSIFVALFGPDGLGDGTVCYAICYDYYCFFLIFYTC